MAGAARLIEAPRQRLGEVGVVWRHHSRRSPGAETALMARIDAALATLRAIQQPAFAADGQGESVALTGEAQLAYVSRFGAQAAQVSPECSRSRDVWREDQPLLRACGGAAG